MKPLTSFEVHQAAIAQKLADAKDFIAIGSIADAKRLQVEIATMHFDGVTPRELFQMFKIVDRAVIDIGCAMEPMDAA